ncbi:MAG: hypothetical protein ACYTGX_12600 [Planctomycetota bacterium]
MPERLVDHLRRAWPALAVFAVLPILCAPGLLWGEWVGYRDAWQTIAPLKARGADALARGELPLWTSDGGAGIPMIANPSPGYAYPFSLWLAWLPMGWGLSLLSALHLAIAGLAARALARTMGAGTAGAWIAGIAYAVSGPVVSHLATLSHGIACAWIPVALLGAVRLSRDRHWGAGAAGAVALALIVIGGEAQLALYTAGGMAMAACGFAPAGGRGGALLRLCALAPLAALVAAIQILPTIEWMGQIAHFDPTGPPGAVSVGRVQSWEMATQGSWRPDVFLTEWLVPGAFGRQSGAFWGARYWIEGRYVTGTWMGLAVTLLAGWGMARRAARPAIAWTVAGIWLSLGRFAGLYWLCYHLVPGFASFRWADKALPFAALGLACCAGLGWARWMAGADEPQQHARRERWLWGVGGVWVVAAVVMAAAGPVWSVPGIVDDPLLYESQPWRGPALRAALLAAGGVVVLTLAGRRRLGRATLPAVAVWIAVSGAWGNAGASPTVPTEDCTAPAAAAALFGPAPPAEWRLLSMHRVPPRAVGADDGATVIRRGRGRYMAYAPLFEGRATLAAWETTDLRGYAALVRGPKEFGWVGALGVRDVIAEQELTAAAGDGDLELLGRAGGSYCYRNRRALPRARLVGAVETVADDTALRTRLTTPGFPHAGRVCLREADARTHAAALRTLDPAAAAAGTAHIVHDDGNSLTIVTEASGPALCAVADLLYPGWSAQIDGAPAPLLPVNGYFRGVVVPAGRHTVTMRIRSTSAALGRWLSLLGIGVVLALAWRSRRRVVAPPR